VRVGTAIVLGLLATAAAEKITESEGRGKREGRKGEGRRQALTKGSATKKTRSEKTY
jgi:hypothetical protein